MSSDGRTIWPLLALAITGVGLGIAISYSVKWRKIMFSRKKSCYTREDDDDGELKEDKISQLPDDLLFQILSRLHIRDAARTCILAKRWRHIWEHRSRLILNCVNIFGLILPHNKENYAPRMRRFISAVDQTLRLTSTRKIKYVDLSCCFAEEIVSDFTRWVEIIVSSDAVEVRFNFFCSATLVDENEKEPFVFPFDLLFRAVSLKHLHFVSCSFKPSFRGHFKSLEYLDLYDVRLHNEEVPNILSSCVNLQRFIICGCKLPFHLSISGPCPSLKYLEISACDGVRIIDLKATNLTTFICIGVQYIDYNLSCVPKLKQISIDCSGERSMPYKFDEVAKCCPEVKTMLFQSMTDMLYNLPAKINLFIKLQQLELVMIFQGPVDVINILPILDACPLLEKLHLSATSWYHHHQIKLPESQWPINAAVAYKHLEEVKLSGFQGTRNQIKFASFLVRNAPMLKCMLIQPYYEYLHLNSVWSRQIWSSEVVNPLLDKKKGRFICEELSRQAVSRRVKVLFGKSSIHCNKEHPSGFFPIFPGIEEEET